MAVIIPGPLATSIHGSIGGTTFQKTGPWQIAKAKGWRTQKNSPREAKIKSAFSITSALIKSLDKETFELNFEDHGKSFTYTKHGVSYTLSGSQFAIAYNVIRSLWGDVPWYPHWGPRGFYTGFDLSVALNADKAHIDITTSRALVAAEYLAFWYTRPIAGYARSQPPRYHYFETCGPSAGPNFQFDIAGFTGNQRVWFKWRSFRNNFGYSPLFKSSLFDTL